MTDKADHIAWAAEAVAVFQRRCRTGDEHAIADLICDLGHLAEERGLDFLSEVRRGIGHWYAEHHARDAILSGLRSPCNFFLAAVSAAVTKLLAPPDSCKLALLGSGVQAKAHLEALRQIFAFDDVRVWSRTPAHARWFAEAHRAKAMDLEDASRVVQSIRFSAILII